MAAFSGQVRFHSRNEKKHEKPRMTRMSTDEAQTQGDARGSGLALRFQIPSQASLHGILKTHRPLAPRAALLFAPCSRSRKCQELASRKNTGHARSSGMAGFLKRYLQACLRGDLQKGRSIRAANNSRNFSASPSMLIRAIRG